MNDQSNTELEQQGTAVATTEIERLLATSERLLKNQQRRLVSEQVGYETTRTAVLNDFKARSAQLEHDVKEELFLLQRDHEARLHEINRLIAKLTALREA